jgi:hypothetical protein
LGERTAPATAASREPGTPCAALVHRELQELDRVKILHAAADTLGDAAA